MTVRHHRKLINVTGELSGVFQSLQRITPPSEAIQGKAVKFVNLSYAGVFFYQWTQDLFDLTESLG
jgi:hypothetical protein